MSGLKEQARYFAAPIRQMVVPQSGHLPFVMGLPFFVVLSTGSFIVFLALHLTQYASIAISFKHLSCPLSTQAYARGRSPGIRCYGAEQFQQAALYGSTMDGHWSW